MQLPLNGYYNKDITSLIQTDLPRPLEIYDAYEQYHAQSHAKWLYSYIRRAAALILCEDCFIYKSKRLFYISFLSMSTFP